MKQHVWQLITILLISLWLCVGLMHSGWFVSHDGIFHVRRAAEMVEQLKSGVFPVRYAPSLDNGYGVPLFNYIYPGPYYLVSLAHLLTGIGLPTLIKLLMFASVLGGALGWYTYFRHTRAIAWVASLVSLFTPYILLNIYVRGALGETLALGLLPWALVAQQQVLKSGKLAWYSPLALALAFIAHNFVGYLALPLLLLHLHVGGKHLRAGFTNILLGLGLAYFFWLPMYAERGLLLSGAHNVFSFPYRDHFVAWWQFVSSPWGYGFSYPGVEQDGISFALGLIPLGAIMLSLWLIMRGWSSKHSRISAVTVLLIVITLFLMTSSSQFLWDLIPPLAALQFPWRLLGIVALLVPYLTGTVLQTVKSEKNIYLLGIVLCVIGLFSTFTYRAPKELLSKDEFTLTYAQWAQGTTTSYREEIVPRWSLKEHVGTSPDLGNEITFTKTVDVTTPHTVAKNYFPIWQGSIDGKPLELTPSESGEISLILEPGTHTYRIALGSTRTEKLANLITLISLGLLLYRVRYTKRV